MILKPSSRVGPRKMFVIDNRHTIKIQQFFVLIKDGLLEERGGRRVVCSNCIEPMWSYLAPAHPRPLQTDNGRNVLPPVQSCTSNILKLCPSALPHHHKKPKSYSTRPRLISSAVFLINICVAILESSHFRHPCCVLSFCLL